MIPLSKVTTERPEQVGDGIGQRLLFYEVNSLWKQVWGAGMAIRRILEESKVGVGRIGARKGHGVTFSVGVGLRCQWRKLGC